VELHLDTPAAWWPLHIAPLVDQSAIDALPATPHCHCHCHEPQRRWRCWWQWCNVRLTPLPPPLNCTAIRSLQCVATQVLEEPCNPQPPSATDQLPAPLSLLGCEHTLNGRSLRYSYCATAAPSKAISTRSCKACATWCTCACSPSNVELHGVALAPQPFGSVAHSEPLDSSGCREFRSCHVVFEHSALTHARLRERSARERASERPVA